VFEPGSPCISCTPNWNRNWTAASQADTGEFRCGIYSPKSIIEAMATNEILQIVVFSMFFGIACASIGDLAKPTVKLPRFISAHYAESHRLCHALCTGGGICRYRLGYRPTWHRCPAVLQANLSGILFWAIVAVASAPRFAWAFYFSAAGCYLCCATSANPCCWLSVRPVAKSAYPKLLQQLERFGCDEKVCGLVLPLGYSFNLDGSMMYMTFCRFVHCPGLRYRHGFK